MESEAIIIRLKRLYINQRKSVGEIAHVFGCSENKINYWLKKGKIPKRTISEAIYLKNNPKGDPFKFKYPRNIEEAINYGMGLGLYWGEGNKANKTAVRLGNTDSNLIKKFIEFLTKFFQIKKSELRFHLQIFSDIDVEQALGYWIKQLKVSRKQFYRPHITKSGKIGSYKKKSQYGVITVYYLNKKLRDLIIEKLPL